MNIRGRYRSRHQECILNLLKRHQNLFLTADTLMELLKKDGSTVSQTTVYRALERFTDDGLVARLPSADGSRTQYRYIVEKESFAHGKLVCLKCGATQPLECRQLDSLSQHIRDEHHFLIDPRRTVLYGLCQHCLDKK